MLSTRPYPLAILAHITRLQPRPLCTHLQPDPLCDCIGSSFTPVFTSRVSQCVGRFWSCLDLARLGQTGRKHHQVLFAPAKGRDAVDAGIYAACTENRPRGSLLYIASFPLKKIRLWLYTLCLLSAGPECACPLSAFPIYYLSSLSPPPHSLSKSSSSTTHTHTQKNNNI